MASTKGMDRREFIVTTLTVGAAIKTTMSGKP
jgi:hypothetical protein